MLAGALAAALGSAPARAAQYEIFIDIDDEDDLYDLRAADAISEDTFQTLLELLRRGVDLETATREDLYALPNLTYDDVDRILAYRSEAGRIGHPANLVAAGVLSAKKARAIAAFLTVPDRTPRVETHGEVRYRTTYLIGDPRVPPMALQARIRTARHLDMGVAATLQRNTVRDVRWDPTRESEGFAGALVAREPAPRPRLPKFHLAWDTPKWGILVGTYRIGFGQRLVMDTTSRYTPNGFYADNLIRWSTNATRRCRESEANVALPESPCAGEKRYLYGTPDFDWTFGLRGLAVGAHHIDVPVGWLQAYGFFSYQTFDVYQYQLRNPTACPDPTNDATEGAECKAPWVYNRDAPVDEPTRFSFSNLPRMYDEILGGGNFSYFYDRRTHVGVTGYGATLRFRVADADLDLQDWAKRPYGGPYGAVGIDGSYGVGWADFFVEAAGSFDSMGDGPPGGFAVLARQTATFGRHEIELSERYYDNDYANPYAGPISQPDTLDGLRARDEAGGRLKYTGVVKNRLFMRGLADFWVQPTDKRAKTQIRLRTDVQATRWLRPGIWFEYDDRDLRAGGHASCYETSTMTDLEGEPLLCTGGRILLRGRVRFDPIRRMYFSLSYQHEWLDDDDPAYADKFRQDLTAYAQIAARPLDPWRLRARLRYAIEDIGGRAATSAADAQGFGKTETLWIYAETSYDILRHFLISLRYDIRFFLDAREASTLRSPNPEHWLRLQLAGRF